MSADSPSTNEIIRCEVADRIAVITLNRPDQLNAWNPEMEAGALSGLPARTQLA